MNLQAVSTFIIYATNAISIFGAVYTLYEQHLASTFLNKINNEFKLDTACSVSYILLSVHWLLNAEFIDAVGMVDALWSIVLFFTFIGLAFKYRNIRKRVTCYQGSKCFKKGCHSHDHLSTED